MYYKYSIILTFIIFIICNILTLNISPLPWVDEIFYVDVTNSLLNNSAFTSTVSPQSGVNQVLYYGPIYFKIQFIIIKYVGLNPFNFRFLNFFSGLVIICLLYIFYNIRNWILLLLLFSPIYIQNLHSGRMDLLATLFCIIGAIFINKKKINILSILLMTLFFVLAVLTTPRVIFLFSGFYFYYIFLELRNKRYNYFFFFLFSGFTIILSLLFWSLISCGTLLGAYSELFTNKIFNNHVGTSFLRNRLEDILIIFHFLIFIYLYIKKLLNRNIIIVTISIFSFLICVKEVGPYSAMLIPFLIIGINEMHKIFPKIHYFQGDVQIHQQKQNNNQRHQLHLGALGAS